MALDPKAAAGKFALKHRKDIWKYIVGGFAGIYLLVIMVVMVVVVVFFGGNNKAGASCKFSGDFALRAPEITDKAKLAEAIDQYIQSKQPSSPFSGMGQYFVEGGHRAGINPILAVGIAQKESSLGTANSSLVTQANNAFGRGASDDQPHIQTNRKWYKWASWQESIYSSQFPASGDTSQPDDIFQYIARVYENNLDNGLESFLEGPGDLPGYAPSEDSNDVAAYIETLTQVSGEVAELAGDSIDLAKVKSDACSNPEGLIGTIVAYAWPEYRPRPLSTVRKDEYQEAHNKAAANGEYLGGCGGNDCGAFITRVMRDSGYDAEYNPANGNTTHQSAYLRENWIEVPVSSTSDLQPGDVAMKTGSPGHTFIWVGQVEGFGSNIASASIGTPCFTSRAPMAGRENPLDPSYNWYRKP